MRNVWVQYPPRAAAWVDFEDFAVSRYQAGGDLDQTFGGNGKVRTVFDGAEAQDLVLDADRAQAVLGVVAIVGLAAAAHQHDQARYRSSVVHSSFRNGVVPVAWRGSR